jgi:hypothetical protein
MQHCEKMPTATVLNEKGIMAYSDDNRDKGRETRKTGGDSKTLKQSLPGRKR